MSRVVLSQFVTVDGVIEDPLGRVTYEGFAEAWPSREADASHTTALRLVESTPVRECLILRDEPPARGSA